MIYFNLPIDPIAKGRPRFWNGRVTTPTLTRSYERQVRALAHQYRPEKPYEGPVNFFVTFWFRRPKRPKHKSHLVRPDLDNLVKAVTDALNGMFWIDDVQLVRIRAHKLYAPHGSPGAIEIIVSREEAVK